MVIYEKIVYISQEPNPEEKLTENEIVPLNRAIFDSGVNLRELRIRHLRLQQRIDNNWVFIDNKEESKQKASSLEFEH